MNRLGLLLLLLVVGCAGRDAPTIVTVRDGQWVWSAADSVVLAERHVLPGVWVSTIRVASTGDSLIQSLALSPLTGGTDRIAAVIRFDPSVGRWWTARNDRDAAAQIDRRLKGLLAILDRSRVVIAEVQLDFDCPMSLLPAYADALHRVRHSALAGREVWITSLVAHQRDPRFGRRLRGAVDGQIVQLFDTGDRADPARLAELARLLPAQGLPFRIGLGAFERRFRDGRMTDHVAWFGALATFKSWPGYSGLWVFPAGFSYARLLAMST